MKHFLEILREFTLLGLTSFGGPTAHVAFFRDRFVGVKKWLGESDFADLLALCQFLPGPASSQLGLAIGWRRGGLAGAAAAWIGFTLPSAIALILFGIGVMAVSDGGFDASAGWLRGLQIAVVAVIANAVASMWKSLCPGRSHQFIALAAGAVMLLSEVAWMQLVVIVFGGALGFIFFRKSVAAENTDLRGLSERPNPVGNHPVGSVSGSRWFGMACLVVFFSLLFAMPFFVSSGSDNSIFAAFNAMFRSGALVFGGGHVVLPLLSQEVVTPGWLTGEEFLAGYGAAQAVPGPLFTFAAYLGSIMEGVGGPWLMGAVCLVGIFLPAWLLVLGVLPFWGDLVKKPSLRAALIGTNAAVVGLLGAALYSPVWTKSITSTNDVVFLTGVAALYFVAKLPVWLVVILAGLAGWVFL
ncbi:chromate efflux transporter [Verrucomicrobiales bacterium BCK34]|nr:chromate efflux transporter [Verrucomicrobiales bacterium BCK34]